MHVCRYLGLLKKYVIKFVTVFIIYIFARLQRDIYNLKWATGQGSVTLIYGMLIILHFSFSTFNPEMGLELSPRHMTGIAYMRGFESWN